jgi:hypothetical protein
MRLNLTMQLNLIILNHLNTSWYANACDTIQGIKPPTYMSVNRLQGIKPPTKVSKSSKASSPQRSLSKAPGHQAPIFNEYAMDSTSYNLGNIMNISYNFIIMDIFLNLYNLDRLKQLQDIKWSTSLNNSKIQHIAVVEYHNIIWGMNYINVNIIKHHNSTHTSLLIISVI